MVVRCGRRECVLCSRGPPQSFSEHVLLGCVRPSTCVSALRFPCLGETGGARVLEVGISFLPRVRL